MKHLRNVAFSVLFFALFVTAFAQKQQIRQVLTKPPVRASVSLQELRLDSKLMAREMPYRVILPKNYETDKETRFPVLYLLHGLTGHFDNWTDNSKIKDYAENYNYIIVTPEGGDGWYTDSGSVRNDKYESYIVQELIPEIDAKFRTLADREHRAIAGLSMGGYGSLKFGLKYPEKFVVVGSFSGALAITSWTVKDSDPLSRWKAWTDSIQSVYGAKDGPTRPNNDIYKILRELSTEKLKALPFLYIDCGTEDIFFQQNREFSTLLLEKKIPHEFRELPGAHDWKFWDSQVQEFLRVSQKFIK